MVRFDPFDHMNVRVMAGLITMAMDGGSGGWLNTTTMGRCTDTLSSPSAGLVLTM